MPNCRILDTNLINKSVFDIFNFLFSFKDKYKFVNLTIRWYGSMEIFAFVTFFCKIVQAQQYPVFILDRCDNEYPKALSKIYNKIIFMYF